jgi:hypothetical protein
VAHGFAGQGVCQPQGHRFVREQLQCPPFPSRWRGTTGDRDEMRRAFAREPGRGARSWPFRERPEALFHEALARALDRDATRRDLLGNFLIAESFIGFQQNARARHLAGGGLAGVEQAQKCVSLCRC